MRHLISGADDNYPLLREAVIQGDLQEVCRLAKYAKLVPDDNPEGSPLYHAVKDNKYEIAKVLLENGAYVLEIERDGSHYPLEIAYQNGNRDLVKLLIKYHGAKEKTYMSSKHNSLIHVNTLKQHDFIAWNSKTESGRKKQLAN